jgi:O-antigen/teichoic acid export membrane protein
VDARSPHEKRLRRSKAISLARRTIILSGTRLLNQGLILISPMILVRLLSVHDFGRYREFLVYTGLLISIAAFGVNSSLLRFVPDNPQAGWRYVNQTVAFTFASSLLIATATLALDALSGGALVGEYSLQVALYVFLFVNLDFWEMLWLSEKRSYAVLGYSTARLLGRLVVVTVAAALTKDVDALIWSLIGLETVRLAISAVGWRRRGRTAPSGPARWREHLEYCLPFGGALVLISLNRSLGALFVAKMLGPVALAHYTIGIYVTPIITVLRNSVSDVLLPEMVSQKREAQSDRLALWRRSTIVTAIALVGVGVVLARFAEPLVLLLFSEKYLPAAPIFQVYVLVFLRSSIDFAVPLRAADRTAPILRSNMYAIAANALMLFVLAPTWGVMGAVVAFLISSVVDGVYLAVQTMRAYNAPLSALADWKDLAKVLVSAALAGVTLVGSFWTSLGLVGVVLGALVYFLTFLALLIYLRVPEASSVLQFLRTAPTLVLRRRPQ